MNRVYVMLVVLAVIGHGNGGNNPIGPAESVDTGQAMCESRQFQCTNGQCIPKHLECDKKDDCGDNSDETNCMDRKCYPGEFQCSNGLCITQQWVCDKMNDCGDGSDEIMCRAGDEPCPENNLECPNRRCVPNAWKCDGEDDCGDDGDEMNCHINNTATTTTTASPTTSDIRSAIIKVLSNQETCFTDLKNNFFKLSRKAYTHCIAHAQQGQWKVNKLMYKLSLATKAEKERDNA